ncbi:MAG: hypothetical protein AAF958_02325 [Planctomycetota bacterium]
MNKPSLLASFTIVTLMLLGASGCVGPMACGPDACGPLAFNQCGGSESCDGCGELYVDPWINEPADCCDPCDHCGNYNGQSCGKCRGVFTGFPSLWGYRRYAACGDCNSASCDGGCGTTCDAGCGTLGVAASCDGCGSANVCGCEGGGGALNRDYHLGAAQTHPDAMVYANDEASLPPAMGDGLVGDGLTVKQSPLPIASDYQPDRTRKIFTPRR